MLLKWAGGKSWLVKNHSEIFHNNEILEFKNYIEPFLGGGATFFHLKPSDGHISDSNEELINFYRVIKDFPEQIEAMISEHHRLHSRDHYYFVRNSKLYNDVDRAARFLYLNRTCWNGLYRVNRQGIFNVPIGTKTKVALKSDNFREASQILKKVSLSCEDFETVIDRAKQNDFIFADPPYTVKHNLNGFVNYNETLFSWNDQERLKNALIRASMRGCYIFLTNADHSSIHDLYATHANYEKIKRSSIISGSKVGRCSITEAVFTFNY